MGNLRDSVQIRGAETMATPPCSDSEKLFPARYLSARTLRPGGDAMSSRNWRNGSKA